MAIKKPTINAAKGDYLSKEVLIEAMELSPDIPFDCYQFARMAFTAHLKMQILKNTGKEPVIKCEGDGVRILTDSEAVDYVNEQFILGLRRAVRAHYTQKKIDITNLTSDEKNKNRIFINNQSMVVSSIKKAVKKNRLLGIIDISAEAVG